jgi:arylsulfatase
MAGNTPFRLYKLNTHRGGHSVPFIVHWPAGLDDSTSGTFRRQYTYITDLLPTVLEIIGVKRPDARNGKPLKPLAGSSFLATFADPSAPSVHPEQHVELHGHRGYYREGWEVVTLHHPLTPFTDAEWELYYLQEDPTELRNLAAERPEKLAELAEAWEKAAWDHQVYPLDEGSQVKYVVRPPWTEVYSEPVTVAPGTPTLERWRSVQLIWFRGCRFTAEVDFASGDQGFLFAHGDQGSGYGTYVLDDELVFVHNDGRGHLRRLSGGRVPVGARRIVTELTAPGAAKWSVSLSIDDEERGTLDDVPMLFGIAPFEGIDVGIDRRSPVAWDLYERFGPFAYTGTLQRVHIQPGEPAPDSPSNMLDVLREMGAKFE